MAGQGVYLVVVDRGLDRQVQTSPSPATTKALAECAGSGRAVWTGRIVIMEGIPCRLIPRVEAFKAVLQIIGISILDSQPCNGTPA